MAYFHVLQAELRDQDRRELLAKCLASGALTQEKAKLVSAEIDAIAAGERALAKAIAPGPPLTEIVKHGWWGALPNAPFQRAAS